MVFVWPIFFRALLLAYFLSFDLSQLGLSLKLNLGFFVVLTYALFYFCLDKKAGSLTVLICFACWVGAKSLASRLGFSLVRKHLRSSLDRMQMEQIGIGQLHWSTANYEKLYQWILRQEEGGSSVSTANIANYLQIRWLAMPCSGVFQEDKEKKSYYWRNDCWAKENSLDG